MNRVAVIVLNYKGIEDTIACIKSLSLQTYENFTIVAIENGSGDSSTEEFKKLKDQYGDQLVTLFNKQNLGFAGGVNTGITWALKNNYPYIALFNNDAIADENWLEALVNTALEQRSDITTGLLLHQDGSTIDSTGDWYTTWGLPFPRNRNETTKNAPPAGEVFSASGGGSLYTADLFKKIGMFDDRFFAYYEDTDISFRAQLAGFKVYYNPKAVAYHKQGGTSKKMPGFAIYQTFKNLPLLYIKNVPSGLLWSIGIRFWFAYILMLGNAVAKGSGKPALKGYLRSIVLFWIHAVPARSKIQKSKRVTNDHILSILWHDLPPDQTGIRKLRNIFVKEKQ